MDSVYTRVRKLVALFDDPDFRADHGAFNEDGLIELMDDQLTDTGFGFLHLRDMLAAFPDERDWADLRALSDQRMAECMAEWKAEAAERRDAKWFAKTEVHPYARIFPLMEGEELDALAADIKRNGLQQPILVDREGRIIDGRNRSRACHRAGVAPTFDQFDGTDAQILKTIVSLNVHRRHLTESQRAMIAAKVADLKPGRPPKRGGRRHKRRDDETVPIGTVSAGVSLDQAADTLSVSRRSAARARKVQAKGTQDLQDAVTKGKVTVSAAAQIAELPQEQQSEAIAKPRIAESTRKDEPKDSVESLVALLWSAIKQYRGEHPGTTTLAVKRAISILSRRIDRDS